MAHGLLREPLSRQKLLNLKPMSIPFKSKVFCPCGRLLVVHYSGLLLVLLWLLAGIPVQATVTTVDYWRMGENDPSDTPGFATTTADPVGGNTIALSGGPFYATVNSSTATADASSSSCMQFFTGTYGLAPLIQGLTNNFGVEFWVNPSATPSSACLVYNGNSGSSGWGMYQNGSTYRGLLGGNAFVGLATATAGTWVHLALVVSNGTAMLFANGTLAGPTASAIANPATGANIGFAANPNNTSQDQFGGYLDEVRVFTFVPGQFSTNDLLLYGGLPLVTVNAATLVAANNATLNGSVNPNGRNTTYYFQYGTTTTYGGSTPVTSLTASKSASNVSAVINNLGTGVLYHFRLVASNSVSTVYGADQTFTALNNPLVTVNWWHMGENDSNATPGTAAARIVDSVGGDNLTIGANSASYSGNVSTSASAHADSFLSINFGNNVNGATGSIPTTVINNFGVEAWVNPTGTSGTPGIFYNGNGGANGWGLVQEGRHL